MLVNVSTGKNIFLGLLTGSGSVMLLLLLNVFKSAVTFPSVNYFPLPLLAATSIRDNVSKLDIFCLFSNFLFAVSFYQAFLTELQQSFCKG